MAAAVTELKAVKPLTKVGAMSEAWDALERGAARWPSEALTARELDVLRCISHGLTEEMAAEVLGIGYESVHEYMYRVRLKLAAKNQAHAIARAMRAGLIS